MGVYESWLADQNPSHLISSFLEGRNLGMVTGPDGFLRPFSRASPRPRRDLCPPQRLPDGRVPREPIPPLAPSLAIEVLSPNNTKGEMQRKLHDYFAAGAESVWYIDPQTQSAVIYSRSRTVHANWP